MLMVVNNGTHFLAEMQDALLRLDVEYTVVPGYESMSADVLASFSGVILTGGQTHIYEPQELEAIPLNEKILTLAKRPILGVCLGHQLIAHHYGATIAPLEISADQNEPVEIVQDDPLFAGLPKRIVVRVAHDDAITELGKALVPLARSAVSEFEAIRHRTYPVYGLQFHPESSGEPGMTILRNFARLCSRVDSPGGATTR